MPKAPRLAKRPDSTPRVREQRLDRITELTRAQGFVSVEELVSELGVSRMTVHRDLDALVDREEICRVQGGASTEHSAAFESDFESRSLAHRAEKLAIAHAAALLMSDGETIILGDSSTTALITNHLDRLERVTVITNSVPVIEKVAMKSGISLICLGGDFDRRRRAFLGIICESSLNALHADTLYLSASALLGSRVMHQDERVARVRQSMMDAAQSKILLLDHSKIGKGAAHQMASITDFDHVIVDDGAREDDIARMHELGVHVILAQVSDVQSR